VSGAVRAKRWFSACLEAFDALAFPFSCALCGAEVRGGPLCATCRGGVIAAGRPACRRCAMTLGPWAQDALGCSECHGRSLGFDGAIALGPYQGLIKNLCLQLKHERQAWLAPWIADLVAEARGEALRAVGASVVVPVPLHWTRRLARGYNQSESLAGRLALRLGARPGKLLRRVRATPVLAGKRPTERSELLRAAFRVGHGVKLHGQTVLLVDDVLTTGATCGSAARALKRAGAARVVAVVIGRAGRGL
jgi:ComF family protein